MLPMDTGTGTTRKKQSKIAMIMLVSLAVSASALGIFANILPAGFGIHPRLSRQRRGLEDESRPRRRSASLCQRRPTRPTALVV